MIAAGADPMALSRGIGKAAEAVRTAILSQPLRLMKRIKKKSHK
jgi:hypothetical protein